MKLIKTPLRHLLPLALLASGGVTQAAVTYVNPADIIIPFSFQGVYLDIVTEGTETPTGSSGAGSGESGGSANYTISFTEPSNGNWDLNFFFGGAFVAHSDTINVYRSSNTDILSAIHRVDAGTVIDGSAVGASTPLTTPSFGGSGTTTGGGLNGSATPTHMGAGSNQFASGSGSTGYIAFVLDPGPSEMYGWIQVTLADDGSTGIIHDWAYSDAPLAVGTIPEPSSLLLLISSSLLLLRRKRS